MTTLSNRIPLIHSLRGFAAFSVCVYHLANLPIGFITDVDVRKLFEFGRYGVHVFFMISAVVIPLSMIRSRYSYRNWGSFMLKRLTRLEPPYLITILLMVAYRKLRVLLVPGSEDLTPGLTDLLLHIGYLVPFVDGEWASGVFWTLAIEFQFYLAISLLLPLAILAGKPGRYCFYAVFLLMSQLHFRTGFLPTYAPIFLAGTVYALFECKKIDWKEFMLTGIAALIASFFSIIAFEGTVAAFLTLCLINWIPQWSSRLLNFLGDISYSLYLIHSVSGLVFVHLLSHHFPEPYQKALILAGGILISILAAWIFYKLIELPSQKLASRIKYAKPAYALTSDQANKDLKTVEKNT